MNIKHLWAYIVSKICLYIETLITSCHPQLMIFQHFYRIDWGGGKTRKALEQKRSISQEVITVIFYWLTADPLIAPPPQAASGSVIAGTITGILVAIIVIAVAMVFVNRSGFLFIFIFLMRIKILKHNVHRRRWVAWFLTIDQTIVIPAL